MSPKPELGRVNKMWSGLLFDRHTGAQDYRRRVYQFWASDVDVVEYKPDTERAPLPVKDWGEIATDYVLQLAPKSEADFADIDPAKLVSDNMVGLVLVRSEEYETVFGANLSLSSTLGEERSFTITLTEEDQTTSVKFALEKGYVPTEVRRLVGTYLIASPELRKVMMQKGVILVRAPDSGESVMAPRGEYELLAAFKAEGGKFVGLEANPEHRFDPVVVGIEHGRTST